ncbi:MAG: hypothetical protein P8130_01785 [Deltaproteobacteria bacterium]
MEKKRSFTKIEQDVRHNYRNNLNLAASPEEVKKFFVYAVQDFIKQAFAGRVTVEFGDIGLDCKAEGGFICSPALRANQEFMQSWEDSDLQRILGQFAESATNRIRHLEEKHPDKTEAKLFPTPAHAGRRHVNPPVR